MSTLLKITLEFDDRIQILEGVEAERWDKHVTSLSIMAHNRAGNQNPFDADPVQWTILRKYPNLPIVDRVIREMDEMDKVIVNDGVPYTVPTGSNNIKINTPEQY